MIYASRSMMIATAAIAILTCLPIGATHAATLEGKVVGISDGDTITVLVDRHEVKVRVAGIDAPEKKQPFGQRSKEHMSECAFGKSVSIEWNKTDRYGRTIGKVTSNGLDCGLRQVKDGLAWHYKTYEREQSQSDRQIYSSAENSAKASRIGLWSDLTPMAPWDFRRAQIIEHPSRN